MNKNQLIISIIIISIAICMSLKIIYENYNKKSNSVNNKDMQEIEKSLLNIKRYKAKIDVTITSNKNENKYKIVQEVKSDYEKQVIKEPEDIADTEIIYSNGNLQIKNSKINNSKIYNNYPSVSSNTLFLTDFLKCYRGSENRKIEKNEECIIMSFKNDNRYSKAEKLIVDKNNLQPKRLEIMDENNQRKVYILYDEIEINNI